MSLKLGLIVTNNHLFNNVAEKSKSDFTFVSSERQSTVWKQHT